MKFGIIAAGHGSRLVEEGIDLPKPLVKIGGKPMIGRLINIFENCDPESISIVINSQMPEVVEYVAKIAKTCKCPLNFAVKSTPSSMHTLKELIDFSGNEGKIIVTTVDTIFLENDFRKYVSDFRNAENDIEAEMAVTEFVEDEKPLYVSTDSEMNILGFHDSVISGIKYISAGIYGITKPCYNILDRCISMGVHRMRNYQRALVESGLRLKAFDMNKVLDVDHASDIVMAREFVEGECDIRKK